MMVDRTLEAKQKFFRWLTIAIFGVILVRLITLQLWEAPVYRTKSKLNQFRFLPIRAPRGDIVDSKGTVLAANKIVNTISIVPQQTDIAELDKSINNLVSLIRDVYPEIDAAYIRSLLPNPGDKSYRSYQPVVIKRDVSMDVVERLEEHRQDLPGVQIGKEIVRSYPQGPVASHLLGYIGEIGSSELEQRKDDNYKAGDLIGRFGLEAQYESYLRGRDGFQQVEVDVSGRPVPHTDLITVPPQQGDRLVLTIDNDLQKVMETSMDNTLAQLQRNGFNAKAGAAVAIDVKTGAVLAITSRPTFDPNLLVPPVGSATVRKYLNPPAGTVPPMINRVISSRYPPGSTFKPITGMAVLTSGQVTVSDTVVCKGSYWLAPYPKCWGVHGVENFFEAMAHSCNVYFIEAGRRAGAALVAKIAHEFGLDQPTGIDLPGEATGLVSSPEKKKAEADPKWRKWYEDQKAELEQKYNALLAVATTPQERANLLAQQKSAQRSLDEDFRIKYNFNVNWQPFETFNMAIGQGSNEFTPIELANYMATLADNGKQKRPYLVQRIEDHNGKLVARFGPQVVHNAAVDPQIMATVRKAMAGVTDPGGTAGWIFANFPVKVAAKTGTAESGQGHDLYHGVFAAFAPVDDPQIAFAGVIEFGGHGSESAGLVAKDVFAQYFGLNKPAGSQQGVGDIRRSEAPTPAPQSASKPAQPQSSEQPARPRPSQPAQPQPSQPAQQPAEPQPAEQPAQEPAQPQPSEQPAQKPDEAAPSPKPQPGDGGNNGDNNG